MQSQFFSRILYIFINNSSVSLRSFSDISAVSPASASPAPCFLRISKIRYFVNSPLTAPPSSLLRDAARQLPARLQLRRCRQQNPPQLPKKPPYCIRANRKKATASRMRCGGFFMRSGAYRKAAEPYLTRDLLASAISWKMPCWSSRPSWPRSIRASSRRWPRPTRPWPSKALPLRGMHLIS